MKPLVKFSLILSCFLCTSAFVADGQTDDAIQPYKENPFYWQYKGQPVLLLGGTDDDNVFNWPDREKVRAQLELLASVGGNYDRCTMSSRDDGNAKPFKMLDNGKYDLNQWNEEFWDRIDFYMETCNKHDIIVQMEVWATYDIANNASPFNPENNIHKDLKKSTLKYGDDSGENRRSFYSTVPALNNDEVALKYQQAYIDKVLEHTFPYDNVLYCIDNEYGWGQPEEWYMYWSEYLREKAESAGKVIQITEMNQIDWDLLLKLRAKEPLSEEDKARLGENGNPVLTVKHKKVYDDTETFNYIDIGNGMGNSSPTEIWNHLQSIRNYILDNPHPMNNVKLYGADYNHFWPTQEGVNKFWRNLLGGCASVRFHRPPTGIGLSELAQASIKSARIFEEQIQPWKCEPRMDLIADHGDHQIYLMANEPEAYAIFIPGKVTMNDWLKVKTVRGHTYSITWINVNTGEWETVMTGKRSANWITFSAPEFVYGGAGLALIYKE